MEPYIEFVCDEHVNVDEIGPLVTRIDGVWAYCAGNGESGHKWRRIPPTTRGELQRESEVTSQMERPDKAAG